MLAVDPASRSAGVAIFCNDKIVSYHTLTSDEKTWGGRLNDISCQFAELDIPFEKITDFACECIKGTRNAPMLNCIAGIFIQYLPNVQLNMRSFITASRWKKVIRDKTGERDPKGVVSLNRYGIKLPGLTDDSADAICIGITYNVSAR